ncbi:hypothetical protein MY3296_003290 [Beauveria thailandica]
MNGLDREILDGSKADEMVKAFASAFAGETGPERCIELLGPDPSTDSLSIHTALAMLRDAEKDCIPGPNLEGRILRHVALCQTAVLIFMCSKLASEDREKLVRVIVTHQQCSKGGGDAGDAEYWQERVAYHIAQSKSRGQRLRNSLPSDINKDMEARKKVSEMAAME